MVMDATPDNFGNLIVKDTDGVEHKIGSKREALFPVFKPGTTVKCGMAEYMSKEYIATAEATTESAVKPPQNNTPVKSREDGMREGVWIKELGECIRGGIIVDKSPMYAWYFMEMRAALNLTDKAVFPKEEVNEIPF
jgi:hypothetical protein